MNNDKQGEIIIYKTLDGSTEIEVAPDLDNDTIWLTQAQIAILFQSSKQNISLHLKNLFASKELDNSVVKENLTTASDSKNYKTLSYNLDAILAIGFRVNSRQAAHFRVWAAKQLKELLIKGFVMNDEKLKGTKKDHFQELQERVRSIRTSERNFWDKIKDVFATTSDDYDKHSEIAQTFFATTQNMFHYAITHHTAAEIVSGRADANAPFMGMVTFKGKEITPEDTKIAKNYLTEFELRQLTLLADQFLSFAELQSLERRQMYMSTWVSKLIDFLKLNDKDILQDKGKVSAEVGKQIALKEYTKYKMQQAMDLQNMLDEIEYKEEKEATKRAAFFNDQHDSYENEDNELDEAIEESEIEKTDIGKLVEKANFGQLLGAVTKAGKPKEKEEK